MILVAGIGNVFRADDGFGVEVARRLASSALPPGVRAVDYGIRGLHLAYDLLESPELLVVADAAARGNPPGTLYVIEPALDEPRAGAADAHGMDLPAVFANVRALGGELPEVRLVGCEPATLEERLGLSDAVERAVGPAVDLVRRLVWPRARVPSRVVRISGRASEGSR